MTGKMTMIIKRLCAVIKDNKDPWGFGTRIAKKVSNKYSQY